MVVTNAGWPVVKDFETFRWQQLACWLVMLCIIVYFLQLKMELHNSLMYLVQYVIMYAIYCWAWIQQLQKWTFEYARIGRH